MHILLHSVPPTLQQATPNPRLHWRHLHTPGVWVSLLWGHCSFLLGPGAHKFFLCVCPPRVCFQSCVSSGSSMVGLMVTSSKRTYAISKCVGFQSPFPCGSPLLTRTSAGDTQTQFCLSLRGVSGSWCTQSLSPLTISGEYGV